MVRVFLVDDHQIVKQGLRSLLEREKGYTIVGEAETAEDLLAKAGNLSIDLVISDITLDGISGIELTRKIKKATDGAVKVLIVSMHADNYHISQCFEAGANGYLLKDFAENELYTAISSIMNGEIYTSKTISGILAANYIHREFAGKSSASLKVDITRREKEIIELISSGLSNKQIADKINLSISTVDAHRYNILKKLDVRNTAEMIMKALRLKIINVK
jgi:DNA-binding NarL/FixJ family response regulator